MAIEKGEVFIDFIVQNNFLIYLINNSDAAISRYRYVGHQRHSENFEHGIKPVFPISFLDSFSNFFLAFYRFFLHSSFALEILLAGSYLFVYYISHIIISCAFRVGCRLFCIYFMLFLGLGRIMSDRKMGKLS